MISDLRGLAVIYGNNSAAAVLTCRGSNDLAAAVCFSRGITLAGGWAAEGEGLAEAMASSTVAGICTIA